ncbi:hypothetical protein [Stenotrophomonas maltophilia]|uniref:hypothetical protein n=1 Tax=Stenotrophomonas maltophilia TaxID=40324 RepID=UPI003BA2BA33
MTDLASIEARAQRVLDGMTINREAFARDVLKLTHAARRLQGEVVRLQPHQSGPGGGGFTDVFGDIFGGRGNG